LKGVLNQQRYEIVQLWNAEREEYLAGEQAIGDHIREHGLLRQGQPRGRVASGHHLLDAWDVDLRRARVRLTLAEVMEILLGIHEHKSPGTTGVRGRLYKLHAQDLAPIFLEAFEELASGDVEVPRHLHDFRWIIVPKEQGADTIARLRDLELPNEDAKILARMYARLLDEAASSQLKRYQQAFVSGGQIERNVVGVAQEAASPRDEQLLKLLLFLDCSKGFNLMSWEWMWAVLTKAGVPSFLIRGMERLLQSHVAYLVLRNRVFQPVGYKAGLSQGNPLSVFLYILAVDPFLRAAAIIDGVRHVWGFCDDWTLSLWCLRAVPDVVRCIQDFEAASGQRINRGKTVWLPNRLLQESERDCIVRYWEQPQFVSKHKSLGHWLAMEPS